MRSYLARREKHLCTQCGIPVSGNPVTKKPYWRCDWCAKKDNLYKAEARRLRKNAQAK